MNLDINNDEIIEHHIIKKRISKQENSSGEENSIIESLEENKNEIEEADRKRKINVDKILNTFFNQPPTLTPYETPIFQNHFKYINEIRMQINKMSMQKFSDIKIVDIIYRGNHFKLDYFLINKNLILQNPEIPYLIRDRFYYAITSQDFIYQLIELKKFPNFNNFKENIYKLLKLLELDVIFYNNEFFTINNGRTICNIISNGHIVVVYIEKTDTYTNIYFYDSSYNRGKSEKIFYEKFLILFPELIMTAKINILDYHLQSITTTKMEIDVYCQTWISHFLVKVIHDGISPSEYKKNFEDLVSDESTEISKEDLLNYSKLRYENIMLKLKKIYYTKQLKTSINLLKNTSVETITLQNYIDDNSYFYDNTILYNQSINIPCLSNNRMCTELKKLEKFIDLTNNSKILSKSDRITLNQKIKDLITGCIVDINFSNKSICEIIDKYKEKNILSVLERIEKYLLREVKMIWVDYMPDNVKADLIKKNFMQKYLKYKNKYINLKNKINPK